MTEAFICDAVRTSLGWGKPDGALHEVKPITLIVGLLQALQQCSGLDTAHVVS